MMESHETTESLDQSNSEWSLQAVQDILWQRRWLVLAIAANVFIVTGFVTFLRTPLYESSSRVLIERATPQVLEGQDITPLAWNEFEIQRFYQTQYLLIRDPQVLIGTLDNKRYPLRQALYARLARSDSDNVPDLPSDEDLARWIRERLTIEQLEYSNVVKVSFRDPSPSFAAQVVNSVVHTYQDYFVNDVGLAPRRQAEKFLKEAISDAQAKLAASEKALQDATSQANVSFTTSESELGSSRLKSIDLTLTEAKAQRAKAEAQLHAFRAAGPSGIESVRNNPLVLRYREQITAMQRQIAELEGKVGPGWPHLRELEAAVTETTRNLAEVEQQLFQQVIDTAAAQLSAARRNESNLAALYAHEQESAAERHVETQSVEKARREYELQEQTLKRLLARRDEVSVSERMEGILRSQVVIVGQARPAESPVVPRVKLNLALGLLFGLFLGVGAAFLAEAMDNKVRGGTQLAELTGLPLIGTIPRVETPEKPRLAFSKRKGKRAGTTPVMSVQKNHDVEESFRALRSALLLSQTDHPPRSVMVTSALPGEGKSTLAANLGRTLASFGHRTVLIDADLRHPRLHRVFRAPKDRGLTNVLASALTVDEVLCDTPYKKLSLIPGGPCPPDPATLLDRERLQALITDLNDRLDFEFVIVDTPPVLVFADSFNVVPATEGTIFVVRALSTPKDAVRQAMESLRKVKARFLGVVLNGEVGEERSGNYYRYYHYRKGYYQKAAERREQEETSGNADAEERHKVSAS